MVNANQQLKYGLIRPGREYSSFPIPIGNGEVINVRSGRFVKSDGSGRAEIAGDTHSVLLGHLESGPITAAQNDSEGKYTRNCVDDLNAVFRIPLRFESATYTVNYAATQIGKTCDLVVVSNVQYANLTDGDESSLIVVGGLAASAAAANDGYVDVKLNPLTRILTAL